MEHGFWHEKWEKNEIGFHQNDANRMLVRYLETMGLPGHARVFLPLCGKTLDIHWLLAQGYHVIGSELSELAIQQLFQEMETDPVVEKLGALKRYSAERLDVYVGDIFALTPKITGDIDAVYDRAALVALPETMRMQYAAHLAHLTDCAPQLLICFEYDQSLMSGPPFSIDADMTARLYDGHYDLTQLDSAEVPGGLKGVCPATEIAWHLRRKSRN